MVGIGYVGLTTAAAMASLGHVVVGIDVDADKVDRLRSGQVDVVEPGLTELVGVGISRAALSFTTDHAAAGSAEFVFLCVPTPPLDDGSADRTHLSAAVRSLAPHLPERAVVIVKSTVPVGSARMVRDELRRPEIAVVSSPEFLSEGRALDDCLHPDRLVIGTDDDDVASRVLSLYQGIVTPVVTTDAETAELTKYAANAFLAMKISFMNEMAALCERVGADVSDVAVALGHDPRIGEAYLRPGPGWGGSCLPKDTRALVAMAEAVGGRCSLVQATIDVNERQLTWVVEKIAAAVPAGLDGARVAVWGITFKPGTGDTRESPSLRVIDRLIGAGAAIRAHDPAVPVGADVPGVELCDDPVAAATGADVVVLLTEWDVYRAVDLDDVASAMAGRTIVDTRNHLDAEVVRSSGLEHVGVGRP